MEKANEKILVERDEFMSLMLECISSDEFKDATKDMDKTEKFAAMWGMAFCSMYASVNATRYVIKEDLEDA